MTTHDRHTVSTLTALTLAGGLFAADTASAGIVHYTNLTDYQGAISGLAAETVEGFDGATPGTQIGEGQSYNDLTFSSLTNLSTSNLLEIVDRTGQTTSNDNALETEDGPILDSTSFDITLSSPVRAFGLSVITGDFLLDGDIQLSFGGGSVSLAASDVTVEAYGDVFFLGGVSETAFSVVSFASLDTGAYEFSIDDVRYSAAPSVPAPATLALLAVGLVGLHRRVRRRVEAPGAD